MMQFGEYDFHTFHFGAGEHNSREEGMCIMEAVAYVAGEPHSDRPECACPVISMFMRTWNDGLETGEDRSRLLSQFVFRLPGTKSTPEIELRRGEMCLDWLVRETAIAMYKTANLRREADSLYRLPEVTVATIPTVMPILTAASAAAKRIASNSVPWSVAAMTAANSAVAVAARFSAALDEKPRFFDPKIFTIGVFAAMAAAEWLELISAGSALQQRAVRLVDRMIRLTEIREAVSLNRRRHSNEDYGRESRAESADCC